ncbi:MAG TPA: SPOR domain-containing protein [Trichocoleus sp.]
MRRSSSSPVDSSSSIALHPVLQAAVENLDVQLEEELTRYRRQRRLQPAFLKQTRQTRQESSRTAKAVGNSLQLPQMPQPQSATPSVATPPIAADLPAPVEQAPRMRRTANQDLGDRPVSERLEAPGLTIAAATAATASDAHSGITAYARQTDLSAFEPSTALQRLAQPEDVEDPDSYLESSEELLRSIAEEDPDLRADPQPDRLLDTLLTPLGIGSMLLLLLSSATLGYVVMNPSSLGFLSAQRQESGATPTNSVGQASPDSVASKPPTPDLAADEFKDLNLTTLSTIPKQPGLAATAPTKPQSETAKPKATSQTANTAASNQARSSAAPENSATMPSVTVPAQPAVSAPAPAPVAYVPPAPAPYIPPASPPVAPASVAPAQPENEDPPRRSEAPAPEVAAAPASRPASQNYLYVVTPYSGDSSLRQARGAVPDAYVRNFSDGARVQVGAFRNEDEAQKLVQDLQQQGIEAEIQSNR